MKFAVSVLSVLALAAGLSAFKLPAIGSGELAKDMQDLLDLIPMEKVKQLVRAYLDKDKEFQTAIQILSSKELYQLMMDIEAAPEYAELCSFMQKSGLDAYYMLKVINELMANSRSFAESQAFEELEGFADTQISGGLIGFAVDFNSLVDIEKMQDLFNEKIAAGGVFTEYYNMSMSPRFLEFYKKTFNNVHYQILVWEAERKHLNSLVFHQLLFMMGIIGAVVA